MHSFRTPSGNALGHPRFHVLCRRRINRTEVLDDLPSLGCTEIITEQQNNVKTAFLTKEDQNEALHRILRTDYGHQVIEMLENGRNEIVLKSSMRNLMPDLMMARVSKGNQIENESVISTVLILGKGNFPRCRHFQFR